MSSRKNRTTTKKARKRYLKIRFLSKEEKKERQQNSHEHNKNVSEDRKPKLAEYRKKYFRLKRNALL